MIAAPLALDLLRRFWPFVAIAVFGLLLAGQQWRIDRLKKQFVEVQAEFKVFKANVEALGKQAQERSIAQAKLDFKRKEIADAENLAERARLTSTIARLRDDLERSRRSIVPAAPAGSRCPEGQACFDRAELERALRIHLEATRRLVDEGSAVEIDLNTARRWAQGGEDVRRSDQR